MGIGTQLFRRQRAGALTCGGCRWFAALAGLLILACSACTAQPTGTVPLLDLSSTIIGADSTGLTVSGQSEQEMVPDTLYSAPGTAGDYQRANFVQGIVRDYRITDLPGGEIVVRLVAYRTATWAQGCVADETTPATDLGDGQRITVLTKDSFRGVLEDGTKGRLRITILLSTTDQSIDPEKTDIGGQSLPSLVESIWKQQTDLLPDSPDIPADVGDSPLAVGHRLTMSEGMWSAVVVFAVMFVGGAAGILRDRGSRELAAVMVRVRRKSTAYPSGVTATDITRAVTRRSWLALLAWLAKTTFIAVMLGGLIYVSPHWWLSFIVMAVVVACLNLLRMVPSRRTAQAASGPRLHGWPHGVLMAGTIIAGLVVTAGVFLMVGGVAGGLLFGGLGMTVIIIPMILAGMAVTTRGRSVSRFVQRLVQPAVRQAIETDPRKPVMLLRSFQDDSLEVRASTTIDGFTEGIATEGYARFEETVAHALLTVGPVITLGQPGTVLQPLGAARDYYTDDQWQDAVENRAGQAALLLLVVGRSPALMWEIQNIRDHGRLAKTLFVFPPVPKAEFALRAQTLRAALGLSPDVLPDMMVSTPLVLHFTGDGTPCLHSCAARITQAYDQAIRDAAIETDRWRDQPLSGPAPAFQALVDDVSGLLVRFDPTQAKRRRRTLASILSDIALRM